MVRYPDEIEQWRKSQRSIGNGACVEVAPLESRVAVRDSRLPDGGILVYTASQWRSFLTKTKYGSFAAQRS